MIILYLIIVIIICIIIIIHNDSQEKYLPLKAVITFCRNSNECQKNEYCDLSSHIPRCKPMTDIHSDTIFDNETNDINLIDDDMVYKQRNKNEKFWFVYSSTNNNR